MKIVAYYRVSTQKQKRSGLGLEAQSACIDAYTRATGGEVIAEYTEIESGKKADRPELEQALKRCRLTGAKLVIAKLDRLSRDVEFIARMQNSSVNFVCCDMPEANNMTIGLMAVMAQHEREQISARTTAALQAAKARGVKLGNPNLAAVRNTDTTAATKARAARAANRNAELLDIILEIKAEAGEISSRAIADKLAAAGYTSARGKAINHNQVCRILRLAA